MVLVYERSTFNENIGSLNQVIDENMANRIRKEVNSAVMVVKNWVRDAILTTTGTLETPRVEIAVRSMLGLSGYRPNSVV